MKTSKTSSTPKSKEVILSKLLGEANKANKLKPKDMGCCQYTDLNGNDLCGNNFSRFQCEQVSGSFTPGGTCENLNKYVILPKTSRKKQSSVKAPKVYAAAGVTAEIQIMKQSGGWQKYGEVDNLMPGTTGTIRPNVPGGPVFQVLGIAGGANFTNAASGLNINLHVSGISSFQFSTIYGKFMALVY